MKVGRQLRAALTSLAHHKLRSALSALGVVFGVGALVAMLAVAEGAKREILAQIAHLGTDNLILRPVSLTEAQERRARRALSRGLSLSDVELLRAGLPALRHAAPLVEVAASVVDLEQDRAAEVVATTRAYFAAKGLRLSSGRGLCDADVSARSLVCVLGAELARALGERGRVGARLRIEGVLVEVVGVLAERGLGLARAPVVAARDVGRTLFLPLSAERALGGDREPGALDEISLRVGSAAEVPAAAELVRRSLELAHGGVEDYQLVVPHELLAQAYRTQRVFNLVLGALAAISLVVGGTGIMNILLASVSERTGEIGIRRAVGASRAHVAAHFFTEALLLTLAGGAAGVAAGAAGAFAVDLFAGWPTAVTGWAVALSLAMALAVGLASGLYPALRAARLDPIAALRHG